MLIEKVYFLVSHTHIIISSPLVHWHNQILRLIPMHFKSSKHHKSNYVFTSQLLHSFMFVTTAIVNTDLPATELVLGVTRCSVIHVAFGILCTLDLVLKFLGDSALVRRYFSKQVSVVIRISHAPSSPMCSDHLSPFCFTVCPIIHYEISFYLDSFPHVFCWNRKPIFKCHLDKYCPIHVSD